MKKIPYFVAATLIFITACNHSDQKTKSSETAPDTSLVTAPAKHDTVAYGEFHVDTTYSEKENKIMDMLRKLPEIKKSDAWIDSLSNHSHGIAMLIFKPEKGKKDYFVQAGYNHTSRFETYYNFYVDSSTFAIRVDDAIEGDIVPLAEWRKREAKRK